MTRGRGRDARCDGRDGRRGSGAGRRERLASLRPARLRSRIDTRPRTRAGRAQCRDRSAPEASRRPRTAPERSATSNRAPRPCAERSLRCRRRGGSPTRPTARDDRRLPSPPSPRTRRGSGRSTASAARTACAARSRTATAAPSSARNRRSAARPAGNCGNRARRGGRPACRRRPAPASSQQMRRLPDQVERQVREAEIDLQHRRMAAPFAQALAEDQRVVAEPKQIIVTSATGGASTGEAVAIRCASPRPGCRRRSGAGRSCLPPARTIRPPRSGSDATIAAEGTTQRLTPSCRRV